MCVNLIHLVRLFNAYYWCNLCCTALSSVPAHTQQHQDQNHHYQNKAKKATQDSSNDGSNVNCGTERGSSTTIRHTRAVHVRPVLWRYNVLSLIMCTYTRTLVYHHTFNNTGTCFQHTHVHARTHARMHVRTHTSTNRQLGAKSSNEDYLPQ